MRLGYLFASSLGFLSLCAAVPTPAPRNSLALRAAEGASSVMDAELENPTVLNERSNESGGTAEQLEDPAVLNA
ncbi:hypothetical protein EJ04DRAFT_511126 [Polyplosphaeria fusca]|uniref:Uncharacterized protein n=1 Tax=Polyplosphaeria fusca TaxID=682080 RepID=A0A9P4V5E4_9PLEO|nr:hypothetical protein EJ04DRAFT_511126 [Polyplosphaeria fusca]